MKKPADLRAHLTQWVPDLAKNPDKLHLFIKAGRTATRYGGTPSFEYRYRLDILVTDFAEPTDVIIVPMMAWLAEHQPNLLLDEKLRESAIAFDAELLSNDSIDIQFSLELSERVLVAPAPGGGYTCTHLPEPALPDLSGPTGWQLYIKGELVAETP